MKTASLKTNVLLLAIISILAMSACRSGGGNANETQKDKTTQQPVPVMEPQVDSLKKVLDEKRRSKN